MLTQENQLVDVFADLSAKVGPSIVRIGREGRGSGVLVREGRVVTNAHNLRGGETTVMFAGGERSTGTVLGADIDGDLALLEVDSKLGQPLPWDPSGAEARLGQPVFAVVDAGDAGPRITAGYVSSVGRTFRGPRGRRIRGGIEHTAPLGPGSSGGALVSADGTLIGINTHRIGDGFYIAVPAGTDLERRVERLASGERDEPVRLGVGVAPPDLARKLRSAVGLADRPGLLVRVVEDGSPAGAAGITRGDLLVRLGEHELVQPDDLVEALTTVASGSSVEIALVRGADESVVTVSFGVEPSGAGREAADQPTG